MSGGNTTLANIIAISGSAPDHHRTTGEAQPISIANAKSADAVVQGDTPSVTISASAIAITVGDKLLGTIIGPDANGNRHFIAAQGVFAVDPQSALEGLSSATMQVTSTSRGIQAVLLSVDTETGTNAVPVKLQLVQANIAQLSTLVDAQDIIASDTPITLAAQIATALRDIGQVLPQGFALTPKVQITPPVIAVNQVHSTAPINSQTAAPLDAVDAILSAPSALLIGTKSTDIQPAALPTALHIKIQRISPDDAVPVENIMSLLADLPDTKANRVMILQSPLLSQLLKSDRLIIIESPATPQAAAQIYTSATPTSAELPKTAVTLLDIDAQPLQLPMGRLLLLLDTAASKLLPLPVDTAINLPLQLAPEEAELWHILQAGFIERAAHPNARVETLPGLKADLPADILLLFNALSRKIPSPALDTLVQARYMGSEPTISEPGSQDRPPALEAMARLAQSSTAGLTAADAPQRLVVPLQVGGQLLPLLFVFTPPPEAHHRSEQDGDSASPGEDEQIFALAIDFAHLGPLTLRGRCAPRYLNLAVETQVALPESLQTSARTLFIDTLEAAGLAGQLNFISVSERGWQSPDPTL
jgi:hypothetical protein